MPRWLYFSERSMFGHTLPIATSTRSDRPGNRARLGGYIDQEIEAVKSHFRHLKNAPDNYNGECAAGRKGIYPGRWYMQPKYVEIWVESANLQNTINVLKGDKMVKVACFWWSDEYNTYS